jgi:hypothetical protein
MNLHHSLEISAGALNAANAIISLERWFRYGRLVPSSRATFGVEETMPKVDN